MPDTPWCDLLFDGLLLERLTWLGNGKRSELQVRTADGNISEIPMDSLRVLAGPRVWIRTTRVDDLSLRIDYTGAGLTVRRMRVRYPGTDNEWQDEFAKDMAAWLRSGGDEQLTWCVEAEVELTTI